MALPIIQSVEGFTIYLYNAFTTMNTYALKLTIAKVALIAMIAGVFSFLLVAPRANAAFLETSGTAGFSGGFSGTSRLGELIVLDRLFRDGDGGILGDNGDGDNGLGELIVLSGLFDGGLGIGGGSRVVVVERGDTLSGIALRFLGDASRFPELARINNIPNPNLIFPGQRIVLPDNGTTGLGGGVSGLGELIILSGLFNDDDGVGGIGDDDDDDSGLGELIILNSLFSNGGLFR